MFYFHFLSVLQTICMNLVQLPQGLVLHYAVEHRRPDIVTFLLKEGASSNAVNAVGTKLSIFLPAIFLCSTSPRCMYVGRWRELQFILIVSFLNLQFCVFKKVIPAFR